MNPNTQRERFAAPGSFEASVEIVKDVFLMDLSPSMSEAGHEPSRSKRDLVHEAVCGYLNVKWATRPGDFVAAIGYHHSAKLFCPFTNVLEGVDEIMRALERAKSAWGFGTNIVHGLNLASKLVSESSFDEFPSRGRVLTRILAYSDGYDAKDKSSYTCAEVLKQLGVVIETFGVGRNRKDVDEPFLRRIASTIDGITHYRFLGDGDEIRQTFEQLAHGMLTF